MVMTRLEVSNSCILPTAGIKLNLCPLLQSQITDLDSAKGRVYLQLCHPGKISSYEFRRKFKSLFLVYLKKKKRTKAFQTCWANSVCLHLFIHLFYCLFLSGRSYQSHQSTIWGHNHSHSHSHLWSVKSEYLIYTSMFSQCWWKLINLEKKQTKTLGIRHGGWCQGRHLLDGSAVKPL